QGTLAEVIEGKRWHDNGEPRHADGATAKMAHVGVKRLAASDTQHHGTQDDEGNAGLLPHECNGIVRTDGRQNTRIASNMVNAQGRNDGKLHHHDGAKKAPNAGTAALLHT